MDPGLHASIFLSAWVVIALAFSLLQRRDLAELALRTSRHTYSRSVRITIGVGHMTVLTFGFGSSTLAVGLVALLSNAPDPVNLSIFGSLLLAGIGGFILWAGLIRLRHGVPFREAWRFATRGFPYSLGNYALMGSPAFAGWLLGLVLLARFTTIDALDNLR